MGEFLDELREHWDDGYWWADRQLLLVVIAGVISGLVTLAFAYLEVKVRKAAIAE